MMSRDGFTRGNEKKTCNARINPYSSRMSDTNQHLALIKKIQARLTKGGFNFTDAQIEDGIKFGGYLRTPAKIAQFILATA
jgi:hypothetical protein